MVGVRLDIFISSTAGRLENEKVATVFGYHHGDGDLGVQRDGD